VTSSRWIVLIAAGLAGQVACASSGDVRRVENEVALLRAETARQDSAGAVRLGEIIRLQQRIMDSLGLAVRSLRGDTQQDLYNIAQQLVQLQELTGQSQQRLTELRTQLEARGAEISVANTSPAPAPAPTSGDTTKPAGPASVPTATADQMYEASVAQLRRGSMATARIGLRQLLQTYPNSERVPDAIYFLGQSFAAESPDSAASYYKQVVESYPQSPRASAALYNLGLLAERRKDVAGAKAAYQRVLQQYPRSGEAALARDRLKALGR
jgi:tol-pal system protein YbgF